MAFLAGVGDPVSRGPSRGTRSPSPAMVPTRTAHGRGDLRVALVTCAELADLDPDDRLVVDPLQELGIGVDAVTWDGSGVSWAAYDLVVLRSTWDYVRRRDQFVAWAHTVPRLANPADLVAWNTDKRYLAELATAGVPVVPTEWVSPSERWTLPGRGEWVVKPAVGVGSIDVGRYRGADPTHRRLAADHVARLQASGRWVMVQPYLTSVDSAGETSLTFLGGEYSHTVRKGPMLTGPDGADSGDAGGHGLYREETITSRQPTAVELGVAVRALAAVPRGAGRLLYARVDLIPGRFGAPLLAELELTEPSLFLANRPAAAAEFARAVAQTARG